MGTVWPSVTLISFSTPADGDGISASTLSVEISNSGSSRSILSPAFFSHLVMVPSKILSPIWGMMTSTAMVLSSNCEFHRMARRAILLLGLLQALFVPHPGNPFQGVDLGAASEEIHFLHFGGAPGIFDLLRLELVVILPGLQKILEERAVRDPDLAADCKFRLV